MALSQMELIQSLGSAMEWLQREQEWGVPATELRHLCGRIGELYVALITNGRMATEVNQKGYDVVAANHERISVKTTAKQEATGHVSFNENTLHLADRVVILRINTEEAQIDTLLDESMEKALLRMTQGSEGKKIITLAKLEKKPPARSEIGTIREAMFQDFKIRELETGTIEVERAGVLENPVKPALREIARILKIDVLNSSGHAFNTRQLGSRLIKIVDELYGRPEVQVND